MDVGLYIGTVGTSVWFSRDLGETWRRPFDSGLYCECRVFALEGSANGDYRVLLGTDQGLYRGEDDNAATWSHVPSPLDERPIWQIVQSPHDPKLMLAGTRPAAIYRSEDGGATWTKTAGDFADTCMAVLQTRVTKILFDPDDPNLVLAGVEIDGAYRSRDAGRTWTKITNGMVSDDVHGLASIRDRDGRRKLFATTNKGVHVSMDDGDSWTLKPIESPWQYTRAIVERADRQGVMFMTNGDGPPGTTGRVLCSRDYGESWSDALATGGFNSTPWCIALNPADPNLLFVCTNLGQIYRSKDGGESWGKLKREFGEVRSCLWQPL